MTRESRQDWLSLDAQRALVTGAGGAIGGAICRLLLEAGAALVMGVDLPGKELPPGCLGIPSDLSVPAEVARLMERVSEEAGGLDILVHAAGVTMDHVLWKMGTQEWDRVLAVNLSAAFHLLHHGASLLRRSERGRVVLIASINGERGKFGQANYAASKAGLMALAKTAAKELGAFGVRVNAIAPGWIETPMTSNLPEEARRGALAESALGRLGRPEDVARAVLFLVSDLSSHVTGQVLRVDGGQLTV